MKWKKIAAILAAVIVAAAVYFLFFRVKQPRVFVSWISWDPMCLKLGDNATIYLTLNNSEVSDERVVIEFYVQKFLSDSLSPYRKVSFKEVVVPGNSSFTVCFNWKPSEPGFYALYFKLSSGGFARQKVFVSSGESNVFSFVVMGDNRPDSPSAPPTKKFKESLEEIALLHPDFVVIVGDLVYGYRSGYRKLAWIPKRGYDL